ncbi:MAG TPA: prolipoprotein diacylglyceryl transferase [Candidatus Limnocylindria bacterium]|nr:prolipoprotein diacylglyceryl transferase [Candidatus Limnocylindria bacterium]
MIEIPFDPNLHLGPLAISWHGIFTAVGIFFGVALPVRLLRGRVSEDDAYAIATWGVVGGIIGARLLHVFDRLDFYLREPLQIFAIWTGGIAVWGAVIGGALSGYYIALRRKIAIGNTADAAVSGVGLGLAIGRIGDIINGEHHATDCVTGICVGYTHPDTLGQPGPVHLAIGYEMIYVLATVALALWLYLRRDASPEGSGTRRALPPGSIFWLWALLYGLGRFVISFLRIADPTSILGLRQDQLVGLATMLVAIVLLGYLYTRRGRPGAPAAPPSPA